MSENIYNAKKLTDELQAVKLPVASVASTGQIRYSRDLTSTEKRTATSVIASHDPSPIDEVVLLEQFAQAGITFDKMILALWKKIMQDDSKDADTLQGMIDQVHGLVDV